MDSVGERVLATLRGFVSDLTATSILRLAVQRGALDGRALRDSDAEPLLASLVQGVQVFVPDPVTRRRCVVELQRALGVERTATAVEQRDRVPIEVQTDVLTARAIARRHCRIAHLDGAAETDVVKAVAELAHNILVHAGTGELLFHASGSGRTFVEIVALDHGPGIADVDHVLSRRSVTGDARGIAGVRAAMDEFSITSARGRGTEVRVRKHGLVHRA